MAGFKGRKHSAETREAQSKHAARFWKGKNFSPEHKGNIARSRRAKKISFLDLRYNIYEQIVAFKGNKCNFCKKSGILKKQNGSGNLEIVHLDKEITNLSPANLLVVCSTCVKERGNAIRKLREKSIKNLQRNTKKTSTQFQPGF